MRNVNSSNEASLLQLCKNTWQHPKGQPPLLLDKSRQSTLNRAFPLNTGQHPKGQPLSQLERSRQTTLNRALFGDTWQIPEWVQGLDMGCILTRNVLRSKDHS